MPNRLANDPTPATGAIVGTRPGTRSAPVGTVAAPGRRRSWIASLPTLVFLGFVALTAFRLLGEVASDLLPATPAPTTAAGASAAPPEPGPISFGTGSDGDCGVVGAATLFDAGTDVWWSAHLATEQQASADAVVIVRRDGAQIDREYVPPDGSVGMWDVLCSSAPVAQHIGGTYRVEVWDGEMTVLHAVGEYELSTSPS